MTQFKMKYIHFSTLFRWKFGIGCSIRASSCISGIAYSKYSEKFYFQKFLILELAEHSPIIAQNSSNPSSRKNLDVLSWMTRVLVLAGARHCALETCGEKKKQALLLGFAKSIYYQRCCLGFLKAHKINWKWFHIWMSLNLQSAAVKFGNES